MKGCEKMRNFYNDMKELSKAWNNLSTEMQNLISKAIVGEQR